MDLPVSSFVFNSSLLAAKSGDFVVVASLPAYYTAVQIKNGSESSSVIKVATTKNTDGATCPIYIDNCLKVKYSLCFIVSYVCLTHYTAV